MNSLLFLFLRVIDEVSFAFHAARHAGLALIVRRISDSVVAQSLVTLSGSKLLGFHRLNRIFRQRPTEVVFNFGFDACLRRRLLLGL